MYNTNVQVIDAKFFLNEGFGGALDDINRTLQNGAPAFDRNFAIAYSLGVSSKIHQDIEKLHAKKESTYYKAFLESEYVNDASLKKLSPENQRAICRMIGIMQTESPRLLEETLFKLFKKGYHFIFMQIKNAKFVNGAQIRSSVFSYNDKFELPDTTNSFALMTAIMYMSAKLNKNITLMDTDPNELFFKKYAISYSIVKMNINLSDYTKKHRMLDGFYKGLADLIPVLKFEVKQQPLSHFFLDFLSQTSEQFKPNPIHSPLSMIGTFITALDIHAIELQDRKIITKELFLQIFNFYLRVVWDEEEENLTHADLERLMVLIYIYMLSDDLVIARKAIMDPTMSNRLMDLENVIAEQKQIKASLEQEYKVMRRSHEQLTQKNEQLLEEVRQLQNKVVKLEKALEDQPVTVPETVTPTEIVEVIPYSEQLAFIQAYSFAFVGGTPKWYMQMAELLPRTMHIQIDDLNKDFSALRSYDYICLKTDVNKHTLTSKLVKYIEGTPIYLPDGTNVELAVQYLYEMLSKEK